MKAFILVLAALAGLPAPASVDQPATPALAAGTCPTLSVETKSTDKAIFVDVTPVIDGAVYGWTVDAGTIASGQGTASIMIDTAGLPQAIDVPVSLTVTELPNCPKGVSISGTVKRT